MFSQLKVPSGMVVSFVICKYADVHIFGQQLNNALCVRGASHDVAVFRRGIWQFYQPP